MNLNIYHPRPMNRQPSFDVVTLNVRGLRDYTKRKKNFQYLKKQTTPKGMVFLHETHTCIKKAAQHKNMWRGTMRFSHGTTDSRGVLIAFRESLNFKILNDYRDTVGRILVLKGVIEDSPYLLINFYNANTQNVQLKALQNLNDIISGTELESDTRFIFGGDFNLIYDIKLDAEGGSPSLKLSSISKLEFFKEYLNLCDILRVRFPDKRRFTYRSKNPLLQRRLDYLLISNELQDNVLSTDILLSVNIDHSAVYLRLGAPDEINRGPSSWKFNNSLTNDTTFFDEMSDFIEKCKSYDLTQFTYPRLKWEFLKYKMRSFSITYSKNKARDRKAKRLSLESKVNHLESTLTTDACGELKKKCEESKAKLEQYYDYFTKGAMIRSKCFWYEKGEKSTKYFWNLEKHRKSMTQVRKLTKDGNEITDLSIFNNELKQFYKNLYSKKSLMTKEQCMDYLSEVSTLSLAKEEAEICEGKLTLQECSTALKQMPGSKSPGNDGFTKEFLLCF